MPAPPLSLYHFEEKGRRSLGNNPRHAVGLKPEEASEEGYVPVGLVRTWWLHSRAKRIIFTLPMPDILVLEATRQEPAIWHLNARMAREARVK